jgi:hypothetical protein
MEVNQGSGAISYRYMSFFVVAHAGKAWDLSSTVFSSANEIIGATCLGKLVEHATIYWLWGEIGSGWVTTICPGNAANFALGSSGGKTHLQTKLTNQNRK